MVNRQALITEIERKQNFLCVGLDPDFERMPPHILEEEDPIFAFNKAIIDATRAHCVAYKPNVAFYECHGAEGWRALAKTVAYIGDSHLIIADAKRGDIGNTSRKYAETFFKTMDCDAVTVAPYMGRDSVRPFLEFDDRWVVLLALTSNAGADDFQSILTDDGSPLYARVMRRSMEWGSPDNLMFVVGATRPELFRDIRNIAPDHFLLVPGVGAQGGDLAEVCRYGLNRNAGLLVNVGRSILYASTGEDFADAAGEAARNMASEMADLLRDRRSRS